MVVCKVPLWFPNTYPDFWSMFLEEDRGYKTLCWIWQGGLSSGGYGGSSSGSSHRLAFLLAGNTIPSGYQIDHLCEVKSCGNPSHLEAVTALENTRRAYGATETHFSCGHPRHNNSQNLIDRNPRCIYCDYARNGKRRHPNSIMSFDEWYENRVQRIGT